ncbi:MAG: hypothetical protein JWL64_2350 [Frankiales bacterium]|nr:hypothetical protein [Frankiales bacterium]
MLRRHLYEQLRERGLGLRHRRALRRQLSVLSSAASRGPDGDDGSAGVREPRRPLPPDTPLSQSRDFCS